jgi:hypothetical protein
MRRGLSLLRVRLVILIGAPLAVTAAAATEPHARVERDGMGVTLALYEAECDDNPQECPVAELGCPSRGEFKASVYGLKAKEAGTWLATDEKAYLVLGADRIPLRTLRFESSDMSGDWDVYFSQFDDASRIWRSIAKPGAPSLSLGNRTVTFPRTGVTLGAFRELLKGCAPT